MPGKRLKIKAKRVLMDWTQDDLAKAAGLTAETVCRIERGHPCTSSALEKIAEAFGCPVGDLL